VILFENDKELVPTLRTLHKYPCLLPKMQIDQGGIKFILNGAHVMAPGLTSPGGKMDDVKANTVGIILFI
jgi:PUA domain protein